LFTNGSQHLYISAFHSGETKGDSVTLAPTMSSARLAAAQQQVWDQNRREAEQRARCAAVDAAQAAARVAARAAASAAAVAAVESAGKTL
jgi:hypothetical protein